MKIGVQQQQQCYGEDKPQTVYLEAIPDTGATKSVISLDIVENSGFEFNRDLSVDIVTCSGEHLNCDGLIELSLTYQGRELQMECLVSSSLSNLFLICFQDLIALGVISANFPQVQRGPHVYHVRAVADVKQDLQGL